MAKSPLQQVRDAHGSKAELADKLIGRLDRPEDEDADDFARRIRTASNKQLLRLWAAEERVSSDFGSKSALVDAIVQLKFGRANAEYGTKIGRWAKTRLLDLHDSLKKRAARS